MRSLSIAFSAVLAFACAAFLYFENRGGYFGKLTNRFDPCLPNAHGGVPCYAATSTDAMLTALLIGAVALAVLVFELSVTDKHSH
ncbi:hypothetical protein ACMDCR_07535 [Labrys okinawensis]|uniref:hypothetical protein n=1 Tax=Labrys okinawensis TaxID=346911 RepID=UPI0039BCB929